MHRYVDFAQLTDDQIKDYRRAFTEAFPDVILNSKVVRNAWDKVEAYFPDYQRILLGDQDEIVGFINTVPLHYDKPLKELPDEGWDWLMHQSVYDYEVNKYPNCLAGLQVIVTRKYLGKGISRQLIAEGKAIKDRNRFDKFVIPIRPTLKHLYPAMAMEEYMDMKEDGKIFDPWIRTHVKSGAKLIKVCSNSMTVRGDIAFWERLMGKKLSASGKYPVPGGLNLVAIDIETDKGEYMEDNIWICYK